MSRKVRKIFIFACIVFLVSCERQREADTPGRHFSVDVMNGFTPVKDQGKGGVCWIFGMLATIETDRIMRGDSVNLSPGYVLRRMLEEQYRRRVLTNGATTIVDTGTAPDLLRLVADYGAMPFDSYSKGRGKPLFNSTILARKTQRLADRAACAANATSVTTLLSTMLDESLGALPSYVYMLGAQYTPEEFGRSLCRQRYYAVLTSFTHHPFFTDIDLEIPDNHHHHLFRNVPIDSLVAIVHSAVASGHGVCWEGDISEPGFSFSDGTATLADNADVSQEQRQRLFERHDTTDDHCMSIVGIAHDERNRRYYIMKNSWGTDNPYHGLIYVSEDYLRLKTIAVVVARQ
ncbi:MAG: C1 family peptidase [Prevotella sp.]